MRWILIGLIKLYQRTLSFDHGPLSFMYPHGVCRFRPTCSQYGIDALKKYGVIRGLPKIVKRVGRCHPWSHGGHDPA